jgi:hypothetical protein
LILKLVISKSYGGFGLSRKALHVLREMKNVYALKETDIGEKYADSDHIRETVYSGANHDSFVDDIPRDDPDLIKIVEELGSECNTRFSNLVVIEIPDGVEWEIEEYDGNECISEKHRTWG